MGTISAGMVESTTSKFVIAVMGIMSTLVVYGLLQEKIMRIPYGDERAYFKYSLFLVLCNRVLTSTTAGIFLLANRKTMGPVAPLYKYGAVSISNILTTTCQYEALKYVSFPVQTLAKCAKMIPVMVWGTLIMQKRYIGRDYLLAVLVTTGCALFILYPASDDITPYNAEKESTFWGIFLMMGYLGFDGFTSTFQDKLFKGYHMEIYTQIFYTTLCSCAISMIGLMVQGHLLTALNFVLHHQECLFDIALLSMVATASQFFISYTIRTFGALTFATIMTTRQLVSILLSCIWFAHPLSSIQWIGATIILENLVMWFPKKTLSTKIIVLPLFTNQVTNGIKICWNIFSYSNQLQMLCHLIVISLLRLIVNFSSVAFTTEQAVVFSSLYSKNFFNAQRKKLDLPKQQKDAETEEDDPLLNQENLHGKDSPPKSVDVSIR